MIVSLKCSIASITAARMLHVKVLALEIKLTVLTVGWQQIQNRHFFTFLACPCFGECYDGCDDCDHPICGGTNSCKNLELYLDYQVCKSIESEILGDCVTDCAGRFWDSFFAIRMEHPTLDRFEIFSKMIFIVSYNVTKILLKVWWNVHVRRTVRMAVHVQIIFAKTTIDLVQLKYCWSINAHLKNSPILQILSMLHCHKLLKSISLGPEILIYTQLVWQT